MMKTAVEWLPAVMDDMKNVDELTLRTIIDATYQMLSLHPSVGEAIGEQKADTGVLRRIKPIKGYWVLYFEFKESARVVAICECKREHNRGSSQTSLRIAQIREETEYEYSHIKRLLGS